MNEDRRCLVIDAHPAVRLGVRQALAERYEVEEAADGGDALELLTAVGDFDVAIVDLSRGSGSGTNGGEDLAGTAAIRALRRAQPTLGIVAHGPQTAHHAATEAMRAGATAYLVKSSPLDALSRAVDAAAEAERFVDPATDRGRPLLTRRQRQILQLYADGQSTARVAKRLGLSTETVRTHTKASLSRLGARDRAHAVAIALRSSLIE